MIGFEHAVADPDRARALEARVALDVCDPGRAPEPAREPFGRRAHDGVLSRFHRGHVDAYRRVDRDAEIGTAPRDVRGTGARDQRLGRNAAVVDARAADSFALDDRGLAAGLRQSDRQRRSGLPGADDDGVVTFGHVPPELESGESPSGLRATISPSKSIDQGIE